MTGGILIHSIRSRFRCNQFFGSVILLWFLDRILSRDESLRRAYLETPITSLFISEPRLNLTTDARIWRALTAGYVQSGQTGGANFCFVQGHEARTDPKSEIKSCHAFFPTSALSSGALRMTADREASRLICRPFLELGKLTSKVGIAG